MSKIEVAALCVRAARTIAAIRQDEDSERELKETLEMFNEALYQQRRDAKKSQT